MVSGLDAAYKNSKLVVWVEDEDTATYLGELWKTEGVALHNGLGHPSVTAIVEDAQQSGYPHVFGLIDRDFGTSNRHSWGQPPDSLRTYRLECHEIENLLLDATVIAACRLNTNDRKAREIEDRMLAEARTMVWQMAWRRTMSDLRRMVTAGFPGVPKKSELTDRPSALTHLCSDQWVQRLLASPGLHITALQLEQRLDDAHRHFDCLLSSDGWRAAFSGKEIFRVIAGWVQKPNGGGKLQRLDLVKSIAAQQKRDGSVPIELTEALASMRRRLGTGR